MTRGVRTRVWRFLLQSSTVNTVNVLRLLLILLILWGEFGAFSWITRRCSWPEKRVETQASWHVVADSAVLICGA